MKKCGGSSPGVGVGGEKTSDDSTRIGRRTRHTHEDAGPINFCHKRLRQPAHSMVHEASMSRSPRIPGRGQSSNRMIDLIRDAQEAQGPDTIVPDAVGGCGAS